MPCVTPKEAVRTQPHAKQARIDRFLHPGEVHTLHTFISVTRQMHHFMNNALFDIFHFILPSTYFYTFNILSLLVLSR